ncbi:DUF1629 domain-containing protein [Stenotrophomonas sp.]|uniref:imm11 family protein n=1 Tax=Stenotrophomonas sp. TaxID=69392 RepID=UPI0028A60B2C|nr:DUF1629 domain-containing protein [Stenotrophomonas sp.]
MLELNDASIMVNRPQKGEFYTVEVDIRYGRGVNGVVFDNRERLLSPPKRYLRPANGGFPRFSEKPRFILDKGKGGVPEDFAGNFGGYWLVSDRLKALFESVDPDGFSFLSCSFFLDDGSIGPSFHLCDVLREIDAIDPVASRNIKIETGGNYPNGKYYGIRLDSQMAFRKSVIGAAHVFRTPYTGSLTFCNRFFRDALMSGGFGKELGSRGVWLEDTVSS